MTQNQRAAQVTVNATDLRALLNVTEGYVSEHGLDSVNRYAAPLDVEIAIANAQAAMRVADARA